VFNLLAWAAEEGGRCGPRRRQLQWPGGARLLVGGEVSCLRSQNFTTWFVRGFIFASRRLETAYGQCDSPRALSIPEATLLWITA
jgi:hypothetical protein